MPKLKLDAFQQKHPSGHVFLGVSAGETIPKALGLNEKPLPTRSQLVSQVIRPLNPTGDYTQRATKKLSNQATGSTVDIA